MPPLTPNTPNPSPNDPDERPVQGGSQRRRRPRTPPPAPASFSTPFEVPIPAGLDAFTADRVRKLVVEMARRRVEALNLYEPLPEQEAFHKSTCKQRLIRAGNRGGKTLAAAVEVARAVSGRDPYQKYPVSDGRIIVVGKNLDAIGQVMWRKLGRPGAFKIIKDPISGQWRAYRPWTPEDLIRKDQARDAPPLIPKRLIQAIAWENKAKGIPKQVTLINGWELNFYSSEGKPPAGSDVDMCLAGWSLIYDPVAGRYRQIDQIRRPWHVIGFDSAGRPGVYRASRPFIKSYGPLVRATLSDGRELFTTPGHRVRQVDGSWVSVLIAFRDKLPLLPASSGVPVAVNAGAEFSTPGIDPPPLVLVRILQSCGQVPGVVGNNFAGVGHARPLCPAELVRAAQKQGKCHTLWRFARSTSEKTVLASPGRPVRAEDGHAGTTNGSPLDLSAVRCVFFPPAKGASGQTVESPPPPGEGPWKRLHWNIPGPVLSVPASSPQHSPVLSAPGQPGTAGATFSAPSACPIRIVRLEELGHGFIWDVSVETVHNYLHGSIISSNSWFDEEIVDQEWYPEMMARILDRGGKFLWSATPQAATEKLLELHELADVERGKEHPAVQEFVPHLMDNPHIGEQEKRDFAASLSEDDFMVRVQGEFRIHAFRVFPEFNPLIHGSPVFEIPSSWTRYMTVDPGRQICAVLFAAVSPREQGDYVVLYDELYIPNCDANQFGQCVRGKTQGQNFEAFYIDRRGARVTEMGSGRTVEEQYSRALRKYHVKCRRTGHGFAWGSDDVQGGLEACRDLLRIREATEEDVKGTPRLKVFLERMRNFDWEIKRYRYKRAVGTAILTDKPEDKGRVHQMAVFRYLAAARPRYVKPVNKGGPPQGALAAFREKEKRRKDRLGEGRIRLGPGDSSGRW